MRDMCRPVHHAGGTGRLYFYQAQICSGIPPQRQMVQAPLSASALIQCGNGVIDQEAKCVGAYSAFARDIGDGIWFLAFLRPATTTGRRGCGCSPLPALARRRILLGGILRRKMRAAGAQASAPDPSYPNRSRPRRNVPRLLFPTLAVESKKSRPGASACSVPIPAIVCPSAGERLLVCGLTRRPEIPISSGPAKRCDRLRILSYSVVCKTNSLIDRRTGIPM